MSREDYIKDSPSPLVFNATRYFALFISKILWRVKFTGRENIPQNASGGLIVAANHQTYVDPVWISLPIKRDMRFMAWERTFEWFLLGKIIRYLGAFPVNTKRGGKNSYKLAVDFLKAGATLIIFPESGRAFSDGKLLPFKNGAVKLAIEAAVPILPVTVRGANRAWARDMKYPRFRKVEIIYHPVINIPQPSDKFNQKQILDQFTRKLSEIINSRL